MCLNRTAWAPVHWSVRLGPQQQQRTHLSADLKYRSTYYPKRDWLQQHAEQLVSIDYKWQMLPGDDRAAYLVLSLPCDRLMQLTQLQLECFAVLLGPGEVDTDVPRPRPPHRFFSAQAEAEAADEDAQHVLVAYFADKAAAAAAACAAAAAAASSARGIFLPQLQRLQLRECCISLQSFQQLGRATKLASLSLCDVRVTTGTPHKDTDFRDFTSTEKLSSAVAGLLQQLPGLTELSLQDMEFSLAALNPISMLTHLQHLSLHISPGIYYLGQAEPLDSLLAALPASLTALELDHADMEPNPSVLTGLSRLTSLQSVSLRCLDLNPAVLASWPGLVQLQLNGLSLKAASSGGARVEGADQGPAAAAAKAAAEAQQHQAGVQQLLQVLQRLTKLQHLQLHAMRLHAVQDQQLLPAITASSQLSALVLSELRHTLLPDGGLLHVLGQGKQLPQLRLLHLQQECPCRKADIGSAEIVRISDACPGLVSLELSCGVEPGTDISCLINLRSSLQTLVVEDGDLGDEAAAAVAQLANLKSLRWEETWEQGLTGLTDQGVQHFTALQHLTYLSAKWADRTGFDSSMGMQYCGREHVELCNTYNGEPAAAVCDQLQSFLLGIQQSKQAEADRAAKKSKKKASKARKAAARAAEAAARST